MTEKREIDEVRREAAEEHPVWKTVTPACNGQGHTGASVPNRTHERVDAEQKSAHID
jgi:hypothetical protein